MCLAIIMVVSQANLPCRLRGFWRHWVQSQSLHVLWTFNQVCTLVCLFYYCKCFYSCFLTYWSNRIGCHSVCAPFNKSVIWRPHWRFFFFERLMLESNCCLVELIAFILTHEAKLRNCFQIHYDSLFCHPCNNMLGWKRRLKPCHFEAVEQLAQKDNK